MSDWVPVVIAGLGALAALWPPSTIAKKVLVCLLFVGLAIVSMLIERGERTRADAAQTRIEEQQAEIIDLTRKANEGISAISSQPRPLPAFQIGEMGLQFSGTFPGEWRLVPWGHAPVLLDWDAIRREDVVFLDLQVRFGGFDGQKDRGVKFRLREADSSVVAGESDWVRPVGWSAIDPPVSPIRMALRHPGSNRRYVLEAFSEKAIHTVTALGVLSR